MFEKNFGNFVPVLSPQGIHEKLLFLGIYPGTKISPLGPNMRGLGNCYSQKINFSNLNTQIKASFYHRISMDTY
jgi:hypothetical protein